MGGPCGCADVSIEQAWRLRDGTVLAFDEYHGCEQCFQGIGVTLYLFPPGESEWLEEVTIEEAPEPTEFGGNNGLGISIDLLAVEDLVAALEHIDERPGNHEDGYITLEDWMKDNGIHLIRQAFTMRAQRLARTRHPS